LRRRVGLLVVATSVAGVAPVGACAALSFVFSGRGWGHGIGLSQYGAEGFALHGWGYRRILRHYYPGTSLARLPGRTVRVLITEGKRRVAVSSRKSFRVRDTAGREWTLSPRRIVFSRRVLIRVNGKKTPLRLPVTVEPGASPLAVDGAPYRGSLTVSRVRGTLTVVNRLDLELYLRGVVPWEMPWRWDRAALAAQAVAARSYAVSRLDSGTMFDLYADTRDQMYGGLRAEHPTTNRAVGRTAGLVLVWGGHTIRAYYSSTSGGRTEAVAGVPYLQSVPDPYDSLSPHHRWGPVRVSSRRLGRLLGVPPPTKVRVVRNGSGRVSDVFVRWADGSRWIAGSTFQSRLDLRSTWFWVGSSETEPNGKAARPSRPRPGLHGWVAIVASAPDSGPRPNALARRVGGRVLRSADYPTLRAGFWVVALGPYTSEHLARAASARFPGAYAKRI
jgi:stage II sporulation protein D